MALPTRNTRALHTHKHGQAGAAQASTRLKRLNFRKFSDLYQASLLRFGQCDVSAADIVPVAQGGNNGISAMYARVTSERESGAFLQCRTEDILSVPVRAVAFWRSEIGAAASLPSGA